MAELSPDADVSDGGWLNEASGSSLFASIDEVSINDSDFIFSSAMPSSDACVVALADPTGTPGQPMQVSYRFRKQGVSTAQQVDLTVSLLQGATTIATWTEVDISTTFSTVNRTLTSAEFLAISDFTDLRLQFLADTADVFLSGSSVDLNFASGKYYNGTSTSTDPSAFLACSRSSGGTDLLPTSAPGASFTTFASDVLRVTQGSGLLIESARTNNLLNSGAPATQTTASLATGTYTLWVNGSGSATSSAGSATGSGFGAATQGVPNVFTLSGAGTVTVTVVDPLNQFQLELGSFGTSYIVTTGTTVTREADNITSASGAGNAGLVDASYRGAAMSLVEWFNVEGIVAGTFPTFINEANDDVWMATHDGLTVFITRNNDVTDVEPVNLISLNTLQKVGGSASGSAGTLSLVLNGGTVATGAEGTDTADASPTRIGSNPALLVLNHTLARLALWNSKIADAALKKFTQ